MLVTSYDAKNQVWGTVHKFLDWNVVEYCMGEAARGDWELERMARETVRVARRREC